MENTQQQQQSENPFFRTENRGYGTTWKSSNSGNNPVKDEDTPLYKEIVS